jgi:hypothetical protein
MPIAYSSSHLHCCGQRQMVNALRRVTPDGAETSVRAASAE